MQDYINSHWIDILADRGLNDFNTWWDLEADWFEEPNKRRGGWSGVSCVELGDRVVFLKRQENHVIRTALHPLNGIPTFTAEMKNILALQKANVPALTPVYFAQRNVEGKQRAILITEALEGYVPLDTIVPAELSFAARNTLINACAKVVKQLHQHKLVHNCLYPKHLFVRGSEAGFDVRLIDLEKARKRWSRKNAMFRDLDTLNRHCYAWGLIDRYRFLKSYLVELDVGPLNCWWHKLAKRNASRRQRAKKSS